MSSLPCCEATNENDTVRSSSAISALCASLFVFPADVGFTYCLALTSQRRDDEEVIDVHEMILTESGFSLILPRYQTTHDNLPHNILSELGLCLPV